MLREPTKAVPFELGQEPGSFLAYPLVDLLNDLAANRIIDNGPEQRDGRAEHDKIGRGETKTGRADEPSEKHEANIRRHARYE